MPDFLNHNETEKTSNQHLRRVSSQIEKADTVARAFCSAPDKGVDKRERRATIWGGKPLSFGGHISNYLIAPLELDVAAGAFAERTFTGGFVDANKDPLSL